VPAAIDEVVMKAIEPDPERRFASAEEMRSALKRALDADGEGRSGRRRRLVAMLVMLAVIGGGLAFMLWTPAQVERGSDPEAAPAPSIATPSAPQQGAASPSKAESELRTIFADSPSVISLTAAQPAEDSFFGSVIEAGADVLAVGYCKTEPLRPGQAPPGEVYVYQIGAGGAASEPAILRAALPAESDHFGRYVAVSPLGDFVAVVSSERGPGVIDGQQIGACVTIFEREKPGLDGWRRAATFYVEESFDEGKFAMRVTASVDLVTLGSPDLNDGIGAVRLFERTGEGWRQLSDLVPAKGDEHSKFGVTSVRHPNARGQRGQGHRLPPRR
jgi:hypothetical protein